MQNYKSHSSEASARHGSNICPQVPVETKSTGSFPLFSHKLSRWHCFRKKLGGINNLVFIVVASLHSWVRVGRDAHAPRRISKSSGRYGNEALAALNT